MRTRLRFPHTNPTHRWTANADGDNIECAWCLCRPYNPEAKTDCPHSPHAGPIVKMADRERKAWHEAQDTEDTL